MVSGFNTNMTIDLKSSIKRTPGENMRISVSSAEIPHTWYNFSAELKSVSIFVDGLLSFSLTPGNYNVYELMEKITSSLAFKYSATFNVNSGKVTLTNTDNQAHTINFTQTDSVGLSKALGFVKEAQVEPGGSVEGSQSVNLETLHSILIHTSLKITNVITTAQKGMEPILDKIPIKSRPFEIEHFSTYDTAPFAAELTEEEIKTFQIELKDQNGNLIQLNGVNYELSFLIELNNDISKHDQSFEQPFKQRRIEEIPTNPKPIQKTPVSTGSFIAPPSSDPLSNTTRAASTTNTSIFANNGIVEPISSASTNTFMQTPVIVAPSNQDDTDLNNDLEDAILMAHALDQL